MIDTISFYKPVDPPNEFYQQVPHPIPFGKFTLYPEYNGDFVKAYCYKYQNLRIKLMNSPTPIIKITNSLQKYYKGNNYSDFSFSEVTDAIFKLEEDLSIPILDSKITRLDYGLNLSIDAEKIYPYFKSYKSKDFDKMKSNGNFYGAKAMLCGFAIKAYNKTVENNRNRNSLEKIGTKIFRFEAEVRRMVHLQKRVQPIRISTVEDLLQKENHLHLKDDLIKKYDQIKKEVFIDLSKLSICEKKTLASMNNELVKFSIKRDHKSSYKKSQAIMKKIYKNNDNDFFSKEIRGQIIRKLDNLIEVKTPTCNIL